MLQVGSTNNRGVIRCGTRLALPLALPLVYRHESIESVTRAPKESSMPHALFATTLRSTRRYSAGLLAGSIGGLISGFVKLGWEVPWPPRAPGRIPEPQVLVSLFTHHSTPSWVSLVIHFSFSILCGAAYGLLAEVLPIVTLGTGVVFGLAIWIGAHELIMPWIGLTPPAMQLPAIEQGSEFFGHALWGWVIAIFYDDLRRRFTRLRL